MSEDYTYERVDVVAIRREELEALRQLKRSTQRGYDLYCENATANDCIAMSFDEWLNMLAGEQPQP